MPFFEQFEAKANCAACRRLRTNHRNRSDYTWICRTTNLTGDVDVPLPHPAPDVSVTAVFGYVLSQFARDANGKWFGCRFEPREGMQLDLRVNRSEKKGRRR